MRGTGITACAFVLILAVVSHSAGKDEGPSWKGAINAAWEGNIDNLLTVLDRNLRECDLLIATPESGDAKTYDLWLSTTAAFSENYGVLVGALIADGDLYIEQLSELSVGKRVGYKAAVQQARSFKGAYDWFMGYVVRGDGIMAISWVRNVNRETGFCESLVDSAKPIFDKLVESVRAASDDLDSIEDKIRNARSRREVEAEEKRLSGVARRLRNVRYVLLARRVLAEKFFGENRDDDLAELLAKTRDRFKTAGENEKVGLILPRHWKHVKLWMDLLMEKWKSYSSMLGEATDKWRPFLEEKIFDPVPRFKGVKYADLNSPVESLRALAKKRRGELR